MAKKKKFNEAGAVAEKTVWNSAKTRKWQMTYKLVEVRPATKRKRTKRRGAADTEKETKLKKVIERTAIGKKKTSAKRKRMAKAKT